MQPSGILPTTHRGQSVAGCGTRLYEGPWTCRLLAGPGCPPPGLVDFAPWSAPSPLAWRSDSRADWLPKRTQPQQISEGGALHRRQGCASVPVMQRGSASPCTSATPSPCLSLLSSCHSPFSFVKSGCFPTSASRKERAPHCS